MKYYLAPMEGVTGYLFRNTLQKCFGGVDKYFTPFFTPHTKRTMNVREMNDVRPDHNEGVVLIPQILTSNAEDFLNFEWDMHKFGYYEVNINLGCPSGTVYNKGRGSGMLKDPEKLDEFLYEVYSRKKGRVSVKTRLGCENPEEFYRLLEIYNKYPMEELIIHTRVRQEFYKGLPHHEMFAYALKESKNPLCYNGDIWTTEDLSELLCYLKKETGKDFDTAVMAGRGAVADPGLFRALGGGESTGRKELHSFLLELEDAYRELYPSDTNVLYKMKEVWSYLIRHYPDAEKSYKKILKSKTLEEYRIYEAQILD